MPVRLSKRFGRAQRGNVAVIAALTLIPIVGVVGMGLDVGAALNRENRLQDASDSGALAALRVIDTKTDAEMRIVATNYIRSNIKDTFTIADSDFVVDRQLRRVSLKARGFSKTVLGDVFGINRIEYVSESVAQGGGLTIEISMALDNSGSMAQQGRISALKDAARSLVTIMMDDPVLTGKVKIAITPFATSVNVGPSNANQAWMDTSGLAPAHAENFQTSAVEKNRFNLYNQLGVPWSGCVEARTSGRDVLDTEPRITDPSSLFVPMFAPDEPDIFYYENKPYEDDGVVEDVHDRDGDGNRDELLANNFFVYYNDFLEDSGPTCTVSEVQSQTQADSQARTCKYRNNTVTKYGFVGSGTEAVPTGPNFLCNTVPILPLTDSKSTLNAKINEMRPLGGTNIAEGAAWGWRVLSRGAPFTEGVAYGTTNHKKIMILMTDGDNQWTGLGGYNHNMSFYGPYGFSAKARIRGATTNEAQLNAAVDARLKAICQNAKANNQLTIYTVTLAPQSENGKTIMRDCASTPALAYVANTSAELVPVFEQIAASIKSIRLSH